jgi:hypothetical protein
METDSDPLCPLCNKPILPGQSVGNHTQGMTHASCAFPPRSVTDPEEAETVTAAANTLSRRKKRQRKR